MPASSKISAEYWSYVVSIAQRSPRSFMACRWGIRMRLSVGVDDPGALPVPVPYGAGCSLILSPLPNLGTAMVFWCQTEGNVSGLSKLGVLLPPSTGDRQ